MGAVLEKIVLVASSTGGPKALNQLLPTLKKNLAAPVVIVQHMPKGFTLSLAERLNELCDISVCETQDGMLLEAGKVYIAKGGYHTKIVERNGRLVVCESEDPPIMGLRPCADITFESVAECNVNTIICAVLTGMGMDGCKGIQLLRQKNDVYTIVQNHETCVVYGMPRVVVEHGYADIVLPLDKIGEEINKKVGVYYNGFKSIS